MRTLGKGFVLYHEDLDICMPSSFKCMELMKLVVDRELNCRHVKMAKIWRTASSARTALTKSLPKTYVLQTRKMYQKDMDMYVNALKEMVSPFIIVNLATGEEERIQLEQLPAIVRMIVKYPWETWTEDCKMRFEFAAKHRGKNEKLAAV